MKLAYLADIFGTLNEVNVTLQGREASVSDVKDKLAGLGARISLWIRRLHRGKVAAFPLLDAFLLDKQLDLPDDLKESIAAHLEKLTCEFEAYFDGVEPAYYPWFKDPFGAVVDDEMEEALRISSGLGRIPKAKPQRILATTAGHLSTSLQQGSADVSPVSYDVLV